jgi:hypothetical protein
MYKLSFFCWVVAAALAAAAAAAVDSFEQDVFGPSRVQQAAGYFSKESTVSNLKSNLRNRVLNRQKSSSEGPKQARMRRKKKLKRKKSEKSSNSMGGGDYADGGFNRSYCHFLIIILKK